MADEAALALQPGGSPSAAAAEREAASPPTGEPLRKRPRRDGPGLGRSPGEPDGAAPEREALAAAGGGPAAAAAAPAGGEREAQAAAGGGDNGPGLQGLSLEPPPADDFDDDDDEGEEDEEAAATGYRGAQGAGGWDCASPLPLLGPLSVWGGGVLGGLATRGGPAVSPPAPPPSAARPRGCRPGCGSGLRTRSFPPVRPSVRGPPGRPCALRSRRAGKLSQVLK